MGLGSPSSLTCLNLPVLVSSTCYKLDSPLSASCPLYLDAWGGSLGVAWGEEELLLMEQFLGGGCFSVVTDRNSNGH